MSAPLPFLAPDQASARIPSTRQTHEFYLVSHGKSAAVASFQTETPLTLRRGEAVIVRTARGLEIGAVLGPASVQQSRLLGHGGTLLGRLSETDASRLATQRERSDRLFEAARSGAAQRGLALEILDVDLSFDECEANLLVLAQAGVDAAPLVAELETVFRLEIRLHNLAGDVPAPEEEAHHGCGKPDCGKEEGGGCGSGGGCATGGCATGCGSADVDLRPYFSHLREQMQERRRVPLA